MDLQIIPSVVTTSFLISNIHCPSCVSYIQDILFSLRPRPLLVSPSLVTSCVAVQHDKSLSVEELQLTLEDAGFEICHVTTGVAGTGNVQKPMGYDGEIGYLDRFIDQWRPDLPRSNSARQKQSGRHVENCEACRMEAQGKPVNYGSSSSLPFQDFEDQMGRPKHTKQKSDTVAEDGSDLPLVVLDSVANSQDVWRASLAVGGMTCAACVVTISEELKKKNWIKNVAVNLISNSATVDFTGVEHKDALVQSIEDIGYDAAIDSVVNLRSINDKESETLHASRTVEIRVDGMFCDHCPQRIISAMTRFDSKVEVQKALQLQDPILRIKYQPNAPEFTIRDIVNKISAVDPSLRPSIYHPPTLEERSRQIHAREQRRILIRVLLTLIVAVPTLTIGIVYMSLVPDTNAGRRFLMRPLHAGISRVQWALFILATPIYFLCADVFHVRALKEIRSMWRPGSTTPILQRFYRFGSMNMLMSLGTSIAYISSLAQLIAASTHTPEMVDNNAFYFDSVVFLTLFLLIGRLIESYSKSKTGDAVTMLGKLRPTEALLVVFNEPATSNGSNTDNQEVSPRESDDNLRKVNVDFLEFGDTVRILHGGSPPCDGVVLQDESRFDEASLTGESKLIKKSPGDEVFAGTVNKESPVSIKITGVAGSSMLDQIVKAVREGQTRRAPMERIADTLTGYFVPFVTLIAICDWIIWLSLGYSGVLPRDYLNNSGSWVAWSLQFAIAVFVVACPCGLALAAPTALFVGGGLAAQYGILVKGGGEAFEKASKLDCIVFDKTGTLTIGGQPVVTDFHVVPIPGRFGAHVNHEELIAGMVNSIEANSSHTVARALISFCKTKGSKDIDVEGVEEIAGKGLKGNFRLSATGGGVTMIIGNELFMSENVVPVSDVLKSQLYKWKSAGKSIALAAVKLQRTSGNSYPKLETTTWHLAAIFAISDPIRREAKGVIAALKSRGTDVWMLSGDNQITANAIGAEVGIPQTNIIAGVLPSQKAEQIQYLQRSLKTRETGSGAEHTQKRALIAMVGDGINDSPALTTADVGIAIGSGSDIAISSAEFVLVSSNLNALITLLDLSRFVFRRIKFNFGWALVYNLIALPVAAGALYPIVSRGKHVRLDPVWASLAMAASSISVVCSSLALRSRIPWLGFKVPEKVGEESNE